jgi:MFS family permease
MFSSLRGRNFRLFFIGQMISQAGTWMTRIAQTLLVLELTNGSGTAVGVLSACQYGPVLLVSAWGGTVADRVDKRRMLYVVQSLAMAQSLLLGLVVVLDLATVLIIEVLAVAQGVLTALDNPARRTFIVEIVSEEQQNNAISLTGACQASARVFGPALGGLVVAKFGYGTCFLIDAASYIAVLGAFAMMRTSEMRPTPRVQAAHGQVMDGLRYVTRHRGLRAPVVMLALIGALAFNLPLTVPLLVKGTLQGSDLTFSVMFSFLSLGAVLGALYSGRHPVVTNGHLVGSSLGFGIALTGLALSPNLSVAFALAGAVGFASIAFVTLAAGAMQMRADSDYRGRTMALYTLLLVGTTPVGGPLLGLASDHASPRVAILLGAVACFGAAGYGAINASRGANVTGACC